MYSNITRKLHRKNSEQTRNTASVLKFLNLPFIIPPPPTVLYFTDQSKITSSVYIMLGAKPVTTVDFTSNVKEKQFVTRQHLSRAMFRQARCSLALIAEAPSIQVVR